MENLFGLSVASTTKKVSSMTPEFQTTPSKGGIKINEAASKLLDIKAGDYLVLVTNYWNVKEAILQKNPKLAMWAEENECSIEEYPIYWGVTKGYPEFDKDGMPLMSNEDMTKAKIAKYKEDGRVDEDGNVIPELVQRYKGSKMSNVNGAVGYGILGGADSNNWAALGGNADTIITFGMEIEYKEVDNEYGDSMKVYMLTSPTAKDKIIRGE